MLSYVPVAAASWINKRTSARLGRWRNRRRRAAARVLRCSQWRVVSLTCQSCRCSLWSRPASFGHTQPRPCGAPRHGSHQRDLRKEARGWKLSTVPTWVIIKKKISACPLLLSFEWQLIVWLERLARQNKQFGDGPLDNYTLSPDTAANVNCLHGLCPLTRPVFCILLHVFLFFPSFFCSFLLLSILLCDTNYGKQICPLVLIKWSILWKEYPV